MIEHAPQLFRGPRPDDFDALARAGIDLIINLEPEASEQWFEIAGMLEHCYGVVHMPSSPIFPPGYLHTLLAVTTIRRAIEKGLKVYVHCRKGVDRTGWMCAAYDVATKRLTVDGACSLWRADGRSWWLGWWELFFRDMVTRLGAGK